MQLKTILNRLQRHKSFVCGAARFLDRAAGPALEVDVQPRANGRPLCSGCGRSAPGYDRLPARRFQFVPLWGLPVYFRYAPRRVECPRCGIKVEKLPWAEGKSRLTTA
jgi:transposase